MDSKPLANLEAKTGIVHLPAVQDIHEYPDNNWDMVFQPCCDRCGWVSPIIFFSWRDATDAALAHSAS